MTVVRGGAGVGQGARGARRYRRRMDRDATCARHPGRPAVTVCARCSRPTCADELVDAPVGYHCGACVAAAPPVHRAGGSDPTPVTRTLVITILAVALLTASGAVAVRPFALVPALVAAEPWRLLTGAVLHGGVLHVAFNTLLLWRLGQDLEPRVGPRGLLGLAAAGMAGGGLGVVAMAWLTVATPLAAVPLVGGLLATGPLSATVGASGAVFGLMGAVLGMHRRRGVDPRTTETGSMVAALVLLNLVLTVAVPAISVGAHVGGLAAGLLAGLTVPPGHGARPRTSAGPLVLAVVLLALAGLLAGDLTARILP